MTSPVREAHLLLGDSWFQTWLDDFSGSAMSRKMSISGRWSISVIIHHSFTISVLKNAGFLQFHWCSPTNLKVDGFPQFKGTIYVPHFF